MMQGFAAHNDAKETALRISEEQRAKLGAYFLELNKKK